MSTAQIAITLILLTTMALFLWGRWRHDIVAGGALLACVFSGLVPAELAFAGFGHPAVITVACVLVLSLGLQETGAVDALTRRLLPAGAGPVATLAALTGVGAGLSAFMNNVGALALLMPVALQLANRHRLPPGKMLMPLAFGTILGGMVTMIGTPPNLIVSGFREQSGTGSFAMFDFTPVGLSVATAGVLFIAFVGWRIVPTREHADSGSFDTGKYFTEVRITEGGKAANKRLAVVERMLESADAQIIGLVRENMRLSAPHRRHLLRAGDILVIEAEPESLATALSSLGLALEEAVPASPPQTATEEDEASPPANATQTPQATANGHARSVRRTAPADASTDSPSTRNDAATEDSETADPHDGSEHEEIVIRELVARPAGAMVGRSATDIELRTRFGLNLLAISRQGRRSVRRLRTTRVDAGDVLLMQGPEAALAAFASEYGCVPLAPRDIRLPDPKRAMLAGGVMLAAVAGAALGLLPAAIAFASGVLVFMAMRIVPLRRVYEAIDWPVVVLLAALMPVADALATSGTADLLARALLEDVARGEAVVALALVLIVTMMLSDFMNNAATAAVMCPIAISTATQLGASADAFLMAVAIGASCAFLTPIGHQNNTLILGPGGFRFGDYWRLGLPLELLVAAVSLPMLLWVWPL